MKKITVLCVAIFISLATVVNAQECKILRVSGEPGWLPVAYINEETKELEGIAYDFLKLLGEELEIPVKITTDLPWKRMLMYLEKGHDIDMVASIYWSKERAKKYLYTDSYFVNESRVFVLKGKEFPFNKFEDLLGRTGGSASGTSFGDEFDAFIKKNKLKLEGVKTKKQRIMKLLSGRNDYFIQDYLDGMTYLKKQGLEDKIVALPHPISITTVHFAISRQSPCIDLVPKINAIINDARQDGTLQKIINKYIQ